MFHRVVAALFVAFWLGLLGMELSEDFGLIEYANPDGDESVETVLDSLGTAIKISDGTQITVAAAGSPIPSVLLSYPVSIQRVPFLWFRKERNSLIEVIPVYKLHRVLLI